MMDRRRALMLAQSADIDLHLNDILTLDGILNTRNGHDASSQKWENLASTSFDFAKANNSTDLVWGANYANFESNNKRLYCGSNFLAGNSALTIELVVKVTGIPNGLDSGNHYGIIYKNGSGAFATNITIAQYNNIGLSLYSPTYIGYLSTGNSTKYIAIVLTPTKAKKYMNGELVSEADISLNISNLSQYNYMGYSYNSQSYYPYCNIYRFGVSGSELNATEIEERYSYFRNRFSF